MSTNTQQQISQKASDEYLRVRVMTASPQELRLMLLDGSIRFATQGKAAIAGGDVEGAVSGISQCRAIVSELLTTIRDEPDPELADQVRSVYAFLYRELMALGVERDSGRLDKVIEMLEYERQTWVLLMDKLTSERTSGALQEENSDSESQFADQSNGSSLSFEA